MYLFYLTVLSADTGNTKTLLKKYRRLSLTTVNRTGTLTTYGLQTAAQVRKTITAIGHDLFKARIPYSAKSEERGNFLYERHLRFSEDGEPVETELTHGDYCVNLMDLMDDRSSIEKYIMERLDKLSPLPWVNQRQARNVSKIKSLLEGDTV